LPFPVAGVGDLVARLVPDPADEAGGLDAEEPAGFVGAEDADLALQLQLERRARGVDDLHLLSEEQGVDAALGDVEGLRIDRGRGVAAAGLPSVALAEEGAFRTLIDAARLLMSCQVAIMRIACLTRAASNFSRSATRTWRSGSTLVSTVNIPSSSRSARSTRAA